MCPRRSRIGRNRRGGVRPRHDEHRRPEHRADRHRHKASLRLRHASPTAVGGRVTEPAPRPDRLRSTGRRIRGARSRGQPRPAAGTCLLPRCRRESLRGRFRYELVPLLDEYLRQGLVGPAASDLQAVRDTLSDIATGVGARMAKHKASRRARRTRAPHAFQPPQAKPLLRATDTVPASGGTHFFLPRVSAGVPGGAFMDSFIRFIRANEQALAHLDCRVDVAGGGPDGAAVRVQTWWPGGHTRCAASIRPDSVGHWGSRHPAAFRMGWCWARPTRNRLGRRPRVPRLAAGPRQRT